MFCTQCGVENVDSARFCYACGNDLAQSTPPESLREATDMSPSRASARPAPAADGTPPPATAPADAVEPAPKALVEGRYRIERLLGRGGMGSVWLARDDRLDLLVAIKFIRKDLWKDPTSCGRFLLEAKICLNLTHPNIIRVFHLGVWEGQAYIAMEYVHGLTLRKWIDRRRAEGALVEWAQTSAILQQALSAVSHAHLRAVVHLDLKPSNIMLARERDGQVRVVVMDLGVAKPLEPEQQANSGSVLGTPRYMAPEQRHGGAGQIDHRADLYSLGVIAYEMLTGGTPAESPPRPPSQLRAGLPAGADEWMLRALDPDARNRFASAREMSRALRDLGRGAPAPPTKEEPAKAELAEHELPKDQSAEEQPPEEQPAEEQPVEEEPAKEDLTDREPTNVDPTAPAAESPPTPPEPLSADSDAETDIVGAYTETAAGAKIEMVWVPGGTFQMGSPPTEQGRKADEGPTHVVELDGFWMAKHETTQGQWRAVMGDNLAHFKGDDRRPVEGVSWNDALEFCRRLSGMTGRDYTLPTEAQWECACRAGTTTPFATGEALYADQANFDGVCRQAGAPNESWDKTAPVGSFPPNDYELYDMHGNVSEWCQDWYAADYYRYSPRWNPLGPGFGKSRVLRGGSWLSGVPHHCRSAARGKLLPKQSHGYVGFRVSRTP